MNIHPLLDELLRASMRNAFFGGFTHHVIRELDKPTAPRPAFGEAWRRVHRRAALESSVRKMVNSDDTCRVPAAIFQRDRISPDQIAANLHLRVTFDKDAFVFERPFQVVRAPKLEAGGIVVPPTGQRAGLVVPKSGTAS